MKHKLKSWFNKTNRNKDIFGKYFSCFFAWFLVILFVVIFVFVIISAIPGFQEFGLDGILGTLKYNIGEGQASIWAPLSITLLVSFGSILIATPIGIKTATFIKFRLKDRYQRFASILAQSLSGIPSVVFGLFAIQSLGPVISSVFRVEMVYSIINAIVMLTFMIVPTIIALTLNTYNNISYELINNPVGLGMTRTKSIYLVFKKRARNGIIVAVIIAIGRAIGETMALSMLLTSESYSIINSGIGATLKSSLGTLGSLIATNMFSETGGEAIRGVLYVFGIFLFLVVMLLNLSILIFTSKRRTKIKWINNLSTNVAKVVRFIPDNLYMTCTRICYGSDDINNKKNHVTINKFVVNRQRNYKISSHVRTWYYVGLESICAVITFGFLFWISFDILINGIKVITTSGTTIFDYSINTTGQAIINTIIIIVVSLFIAVPISLFAAIYLNEFAKESRIKKIVLFFIDCLGSSPSIIFGMFGLAVFIEMFGWTLAGTIGKSLLAGALTISIVILPTLIRTIQQNLEGVSNDLRMNAFALGMGKWKTIWSVIIPQSMKSLIASIVLATGRIVAETAPLYLTAGLSSSSAIGLLMPGQTLTTRIYAQLSSTDLNAFQSVSYECAFVALIFIILLIWVGNFVVCNSRNIKLFFINNFFAFISSFTLFDDKHLNKYHKKQLIKRTLYLSLKQAEFLKLNRYQHKFYVKDSKIYFIKYFSSEEKLHELTAPKFLKSVF